MTRNLPCLKMAGKPKTVCAGVNVNDLSILAFVGARLVTTRYNTIRSIWFSRSGVFARGGFVRVFGFLNVCDDWELPGIHVPRARGNLCVVGKFRFLLHIYICRVSGVRARVSHKSLPLHIPTSPDVRAYFYRAEILYSNYHKFRLRAKKN